MKDVVNVVESPASGTLDVHMPAGPELDRIRGRDSLGSNGVIPGFALILFAYNCPVSTH